MVWFRHVQAAGDGSAQRLVTLPQRLFPIGGKLPPRPIPALAPPSSPPAGLRGKCADSPAKGRRIPFGAAEMGCVRRVLLLLGGVALLLAVGSSGPSSSHSMRNFYMGVSEPGQGLPRFIAVGYVDDQPINRYDSHTRRNVPQAPWMEKAGKDDPQYWERETQILQGWEAVFRGNLQIARDRFHQQNSTGLHTVQVMCGCQAGPDGRFLGGDFQYAYDGEDFLALDLDTATWTARVPQAQLTKTRWETETDEASRQKDYLEGICVEWLGRYLGYGNDTLRRTEAPTVRVTRKKGYDGRETFICRVHGFYPKEIDVTWRKDGEVVHQDTFHGGVVPNSDGTYHTWLSIEVDPKERDRYRCHVEHDSSEEHLDLPWEEPASASKLGLILGVVGILAVLTLVGVGVWVTFYMRRKKEKGYTPAAGSDQGSDTSTKLAVAEA